MRKIMAHILVLMILCCNVMSYGAIANEINHETQAMGEPTEIIENPYEPGALSSGEIQKHITLSPVADAHTQGGSGSGNNFGDSKVLQIRAINYRVTYLKFDLRSVAGTVDAAILKLYKTRGSADKLSVAVAQSNEWEEMRITANTAPRWNQNQPIAQTETPHDNNVYIEFDVTAAYEQKDENGLLTLVVYDPENPENQMEFISKDGDKNPPSLEMDVRYIPQADNIKLSGDPVMILPSDGNEMSYHYQADFADQYENPYIPSAVTWDIEAENGTAYPNVRVDQEGNVSVESDAQPGTAYLCVTADGILHRMPIPILDHQTAADRAAEEFVFSGLDEVTGDLSLPTQGAYGTSIAWTSSDPECVGNDGKVTRPSIEEGDKDVVLTAVFSSGEAQAIRQFPAHVLRESREIMLLPTGALDAEGNNRGANTLQGGSGGNNVLPGGITVRYDKYRMGIMKYDLSGLNVEKILRARIEFDGGRQEIRAGNVTRDDWDPATITYNLATQMQLRGNEILGDGYINENNNVEIDVTEALKKDYAEDPAKWFSLYIYSTLASETNFSFGAFPRLYIEAIYTPQIAKLEVKPMNRNENYIARPLEGPMKAHYVATAIDQCGGLMLGEEIVWSIDNENASVISRGILGEVEEWPKSDIVIPIGTKGRDVGEICIYPDTEGNAVHLKAHAKNAPQIEGKLDVEIRDSISNDNQHPYMLHTKEDLPVIRERVKSDIVAKQYSADKANANKYSVEDLKAENIYRLLPWRPTNFNFTVPEEAASAELGVYLKGTGEIGLDDASLLSITSQTITLNNTGFETGLNQPNNWIYDCQNGNGQISYEEVVSGVFHAWEGRRYIKIKNEKPEDVTGIYYPDVPLLPKNSYTFTVNISQLGDVSNGTFIIVRFRDKDGNLLPEEELSSLGFNRITFSKRNGMPGIEYATVYMIEDNPEYAIKAKESLLYFLYDAQWGMQYWINTGTNLDDTYQAVHIGRRLYDWAVFYDRVQDSGVITPEEDNIIRSKMYWIAETLMDPGYYDYTTLHGKRHNYNTDRSNGLFAFTVVFPEYAKSKQLQEHALGEILWQLKYSVGRDGGWPETIRYHSAVLTKLFSSAKAFERLDYENLLNGPEYADLFEDPNNRTEEEKNVLHNPYFKNMVWFLINTQTSRDAAGTEPYMGAKYPAVGDSSWGEGTGVLPYVLLTYKDSPYPDEQDLVKKAQYAYIRQNGGDVADYFTDTSTIRNIPAENPKPKSMVFEDTGYIIFRQDYGRKTEDYFLATYGGSNILNSHQNNDRGAFSLFVDNTPMALDAGVGGYLDGSSIAWYSNSAAHNIVSYYDGSGNEASLSESPGSLEDFQTTALVDYAKIGVPDNSDVKTHKRNFAFVKGGFNMLLISDSIEMKNPKESRLNFNTLSNGVVVNGNTATAKCYNNKELDITVLEPAKPQFDILSRGFVAGPYPSLGDTGPRQDHLQVKNVSGGDYFAVLYGKDKGSAGLSTSKIAQNGEAAAYEIKNAAGEKVIALVNNSTTDALSLEVSALRSYRSLIAVQGETLTFEPQNGKITVEVPAAGILVFANETTKEPEASGISIEGATQLEIPTGAAKDNQTVYEGIVVDQYGHVFDSDQVVYSIEDCTGVEIDSQSGVLAVKHTAKSGSIVKVKASLGNLSAVMQVRLVSAAPVLKELQILGSEVLAIPTDGESTVVYRTKVLDAYGTEIKNQRVLWGTPNGLPEGTAFDAASGQLKISDSCQEGTVITLKVSAEKSPALYGVLNIELVNDVWTATSIRISGPTRIQVGKSGVYNAEILNQYGQTMKKEGLKWSIEGIDAVSIDAVGKVQVNASAAADASFEVIAKSDNGAEGRMQVSVAGGDGNIGGGSIGGGSIGGGSIGGGGNVSGGITPVQPNHTNPSGEKNEFVDIQDFEWAHEAIEFLANAGIVNGKGDGYFAPADRVTREEFVKMLLGVFDVACDSKAKSDYQDVENSTWYYPYVATAAQMGIVTGYDTQIFGVGDFITRQDIAVISSRMLQQQKKNLPYIRSYNEFADEAKIAEYAQKAVRELYQGGIIQGRSEEEFAPTENANRAEAAVMLYRIRQSVMANEEGMQ